MSPMSTISQKTHIPATMQAVVYQAAGGPEVIALEDRPTPVPLENEVLVKVAAAGINRPDVMQREGKYPPPSGASDIPGLEIAGEVVAIGDQVRRFSLGDKICGLVAGGGYAQYCVVHEDNALFVPEGLSLQEAAALPETFMTVWTNLFEDGKLSDQDRVLIHGGSSGIGTTAIQLAKAFQAKQILVTVGNEAKAEACRSLGADIAINYREEDFVSAVKENTQGHGADLILDMIGGDYVTKNYQAAAKFGRIIQIATQQGNPHEVEVFRLMLKRLTHTGSTLRSRSVEEKALIVRALEKDVWPKISHGEIKPYIHATFSYKDAPKAHQLMDSSQHIGKIVLTFD
ncbi:Phthiocerol synthesis polyketide synthase type I PpsC [Halomonadaceae bacterium LMG 33818]